MMKSIIFASIKPLSALCLTITLLTAPALPGIAQTTEEESSLGQSLPEQSTESLETILESWGLASLEVFDLAVNRSSLNIGFDSASAADLDEWAGETRSWRGDAGATIGLLSKGYKESDKASFFRLMLNCRIQHQMYTLEPYDDLNFFRGSLGLSAFYLTRAKNLFYLNAGAVIAGEEDSLADAPIRPVITGFGSYRLAERHVFLYGGLVTSAYGKLMPLPLIGYTLENKQGFKFSAILPMFIMAGYAFSDDFSLYGICSPDGGSYHLDESWYGSATSEEIQLRISQIRLGILANYKISELLEMKAGLGIITGRTVRIMADDEELESSTVKPGSYLTFGLKMNL
jgi:hypothetical protein